VWVITGVLGVGRGVIKHGNGQKFCPKRREMRTLYRGVWRRHCTRGGGVGAGRGDDWEGRGNRESRRTKGKTFTDGAASISKKGSGGARSTFENDGARREDHCRN